MLQQPVFQQEQTEAQDVQQMVLCPVGVVYNTQMYVQPGEQVQQNQIIINTQNPPPWIQNRPQNQIIYVQHVPANFLPSQQQHIDQNQLYVQNYTYQNMPQMLYQQDQLRPIQMVSNMMPNVQANMGGNINQRIVATNIGPIANQMTEVQNQNVPTELYQNQIYNTTEAKQQQILNQTRQVQMTQDTRLTQTVPIVPQTVPVVPNMTQINRLPQFNPNMQYRQALPINGPSVTPNVEASAGQINQRIATTVSPMPYAETKINTQSYISHPSIGRGQPIFRQVLPRPNLSNNQFVPIIPNQSQPLSQTQNVMYMNNIPRKINPNVNLAPNAPLPNYAKIEGNSHQFNRKRKSESPDDVQRKVLVQNQKITSITVSKPLSFEVGVNTSPVHKTKVVNSIQLIPLTSQNTTLKEELAKPVRSTLNIESHVGTAPITDANPINTSSNVSEKEKLLRNTVFTQARGRLLSDKEIVQESKEEVKLIEKPNLENIKGDEEKTDKIAQNTYIDENETTKTSNSEPIKDITKNSGEVECDIKFKDNRDFVLTHVLDGYVIQESNVAFPIRRPLKEKVIHVNTDIEPKTETKDFKEEGATKNKDILHLAGLHLKEANQKDVEKEESNLDKDNPFRSIDANAVKSWTVNQLSAHLSKFGWEETVALFQEHEIDGESLFLVSKSQLLTIGIDELHADIICKYTKS